MSTFDYDCGHNGESFFDAWERGAHTLYPGPLATWSHEYRVTILRELEELAGSTSARILSVGAGNGFVEAELAQRGYTILATDHSPAALRLCAAKGLTTLRYDVLAPDQRRIGPFDVIYADGLLGHLYEHSQGLSAFWGCTAVLGTNTARLCISNDLSDSQDQPTLKVTGYVGSTFFRPPSGWFARSAERSALWRVIRSVEFRYSRPQRGPRCREILTLIRHH